MIHKSTLNISAGNSGKLKTLDLIFQESKRVVNVCIDSLWNKQDFKSKFVYFKIDTWLSARMQQMSRKTSVTDCKITTQKTQEN